MIRRLQLALAAAIILTAGVAVVAAAPNQVPAKHDQATITMDQTTPASQTGDTESVAADPAQTGESSQSVPANDNTSTVDASASVDATMPTNEAPTLPTQNSNQSGAASFTLSTDGTPQP